MPGWPITPVGINEAVTREVFLHTKLAGVLNAFRHQLSWAGLQLPDGAVSPCTEDPCVPLGDKAARQGGDC